MADKEKIEYADFSDMKETELPDELPEDATEQHMPLDYFEGEQEEPQAEESVEDKPEPETSKQEVTPKDDPTQNPYWQSKYDREINPVRQENEKLRQEIEAIKTQLNPPKKEEPLVEPKPPQSDDPLDEIRYLKELVVYQNKMAQQKFSQTDAYFQRLEEERQSRIQQEESARQRAWQISQLSQFGNLSPEEATQALADFSKAADNPEGYFKDLAEFWKFRTGMLKPTSKVEHRANRQGTLPPLGTVPSETETQNVDPSDEFFGDMKKVVKRYY